MQSTSRSNWQCVQNVFRRSGLKGLYRGFWPTAGRKVLGNVMYFITYETIKDHLLSRFVHDVPDLSPESINARTYQWVAFSGGYVLAGGISCRHGKVCLASKLTVLTAHAFQVSLTAVSNSQLKEVLSGSTAVSHRHWFEHFLHTQSLVSRSRNP
ncbi:hypothetical protein PsorP6_014079 [Peronosclerospora sorghi]|uniref:Uncharacterized protein n=1 Tax=Peronosclerospora sorghi TaxID=230839 RepID=A0ACC0VH22_9STRA|nr:hypothetical protein PsorP6_014079 [Peronosclerospora sorghi]